jgi:hypothetical protein
MDTRRKKKPFTVDLALTPQDREAYLLVLVDPRTTTLIARDWLKARGYPKLSMGAVHRHRVHVMMELEDRRRYGVAEEDLKRLAAGANGPEIAEGTLTMFEQALFRRLRDVTVDGSIPTGEINALANAVSRVVTARERCDRVRRERDIDRRKAAARAKKLADANKPKATPIDAAVRMRAIMGFRPMKLWPDHANYEEQRRARIRYYEELMELVRVEQAAAPPDSHAADPAAAPAPAPPAGNGVGASDGTAQPATAHALATSDTSKPWVNDSANPVVSRA